MGKKSKRRQTKSTAKRNDSNRAPHAANPIPESRRIDANEDGQVLTSAFDRFSSMILGEGLGILDMSKTLELYTQIRREDQHFSVDILLITVEKCLSHADSGDKSEAYELIITLLEDHEEFVKCHVSIDDQFSLYCSFSTACVFFNHFTKLSNYSERVIPHLLSQAEEGSLDHFGRAKVLMAHRRWAYGRL